MRVIRTSLRQISVSALSYSTLLFLITAPLQVQVGSIGAVGSQVAWACDGHCDHSKKCKDCHHGDDQASTDDADTVAAQEGSKEGTKDTASKDNGKTKKKSCNCKSEKKGA